MNHEVRSELLMYRDQLVSAQEVIAKKLSAIESLLGTPDINLVGVKVGPVETHIVKSRSGGGEAERRPSEATPTLAVAIRGVLKTSSKGLRPVEVAKALEEKGVIRGGKTPLRVHVATELSRLRKRGTVQRQQMRYKLTNALTEKAKA